MSRKGSDTVALFILNKFNSIKPPFYYGSFQISSLNLFKLAYILAGFWAFFYLVFPDFIAIFFTSLLVFILLQIIFLWKSERFPKFLARLMPYKTRNEIRVSTILFIICFILFISLGTYFLSELNLFDEINAPIPKDRWDLGVLLSRTSDYEISFFEQFPVSIVLIFLIVSFSLLVFGSLKILNNLLIKATSIVILSVLFLSILLGIIYTFSQETFKKIPSVIGGGRLRPVNVVIKIDENAISSLDNSRFKPNSNSTSKNNEEKDDTIEKTTQSLEQKDNKEDKTHNLSLMLILESTEGYYFQTYNGKTILIPRDKVLNIVFQESAGISPTIVK